MQNKIQVTVLFESPFWVGIFERHVGNEVQAARAVFGAEPTDPELYEWIKENYLQLTFSKPQEFNLVIKRKNPKRQLREVKKEMRKAKAGKIKESFAQ